MENSQEPKRIARFFVNEVAIKTDKPLNAESGANGTAKGRKKDEALKLKLPKPGEEDKGLLATWEEPSKAEQSGNDKLLHPNLSPLDLGDEPKKSGRYGSFSSLRRYTSKSSLISTYDFIKEKVVPPSMKKRTDETMLRFVVAFFFLVIVLVISLAQIFYAQHKGERRIFGNVKFEEHHGTVTVFDGKGKILIEGHIGIPLPHDDHPYTCKGFAPTETQKCLEWHRKARVTISHSKIPEKGINCYNMFWQSLHHAVSPRDCFHFAEDQGHWYGGGESLPAAWPLEKGHVEHSPFITGDEGQTEWGNAIRKYFANSNGVILSIADHTPLFLSIDHDHGLCIEAKFDDFAYFYHRYHLPRLNYTICTGGKDTLDGQGDLKVLHKHFLPKSFWHGQSFQDLNTLETVLEKPLWQVPAREGLTHERLQKYLETLFKTSPKVNGTQVDRGYLMLDYHWQKNMGDFRFNKKDFPNVEETIKMVNKTGLKLVLTVNPYIDTDSENFAYGVSEEFFVKERNSTAPKVPALTWIKDVPSAGLLDITSNKTVAWLKSQLRALKSIDPENILFYLDTGNTFHMPTYYQFAVPLDNPDLFRDYFVKHCMSEVPVIGVSGASSERPKAPAFIFLSPLESKWSSLKSIIPNMLKLSVVGYPFVNPGAVGGVGQFIDKQAGNLEDKANEVLSEEEQNDELELYIRWWQLNSFLPMLHFIKPPSAFPEDKIGIVASKLKKIRQEVVPRLIKFSKEAMRSSEPVIRPLWMLDSHDHVNHVIDDEFLIGDEILVAPILNPKARKRDIYLPRIPRTNETETESAWLRGSDKTLFSGGSWLNDTQVGLDEVPYFVRLTFDPLSGSKFLERK